VAARGLRAGKMVSVLVCCRSRCRGREEVSGGRGGGISGTSPREHKARKCSGSSLATWVGGHQAGPSTRACRASLRMTPSIGVSGKVIGGVGEENYCNQSKDNYRGPSRNALKISPAGSTQDDGVKQTKTTATAEAGFSTPHRRNAMRRSK